MSEYADLSFVFIRSVHFGHHVAPYIYQPKTHTVLADLQSYGRF